MYRSLTAFGMTAKRGSVIPSEARDLYETSTTYIPMNWGLQG